MLTVKQIEEWEKKQSEARSRQAVGLAGVKLSNASQINPDEAAGDYKLGRSLGIPKGVASEGRETFLSRLQHHKNETILKTNPLLATWLGIGENAEYAQDDLAELSEVERLLGPAGRALGRGVRRIEAVAPYVRGQINADLMYDVGKTREDIYAELLEELGPDATAREKGRALVRAQERFIKIEDLGAEDRREFAKAAAENFASAQSIMKRVASIPKSEAGEAFNKGALAAAPNTALGTLGAFVEDPLGGAAFLAETAAESLPALAAATVVTAATRSPAAGAIAMGGSSALIENHSEALKFLGEKGVDLSSPEAAMKALEDRDLIKEARRRGVLKGAIVGLFDGMSGGVAGKAMLKNPAGDMAAQALAQAFMGGTGEYASQKALGGPVNMKEVTIEALAEFATAPVEAVGVGGRYLKDRSRAERAIETQEKLDRVSEAATKSKLRERLPEKFAEFVNAATEGEPVSDVYVPADKLNEFFQSNDIDPDAFFGELRDIDVEEFGMALDTGGDVKIPTGAYAAHIAGTEMDASLREHMRFNPEDMTISEAQAFNESVEEIFEEAYNEAEALRVRDLELRETEERILEEMTSRLRAAGRAPDVAKNEAMIYPAFYRAMAERSNMSTDDLLAMFPLPSVRGEMPEGLKLKDMDDLKRNLIALKNRKSKTPSGQTLLEFIDDRGGILDPGGELDARDAAVVKRGKGKKSLRLKREEQGSGYGFDDVSQAAIEAGFMADNPVVAEYLSAMAEGREVPDIIPPLMEAIDAELRGEADRAATEEAGLTEEMLNEMEAYLNELGLSVDDDIDVIRSVMESGGARFYTANPIGLENQQRTGGPLDFGPEFRKRSMIEGQAVDEWMASNEGVFPENLRDPLLPVFSLLSSRQLSMREGEAAKEYIERLIGLAVAHGRPELARYIVDFAQSLYLFEQQMIDLQRQDFQEEGIAFDEAKAGKKLEEAKALVVYAENSYNYALSSLSGQMYAQGKSKNSRRLPELKINPDTIVPVVEIEGEVNGDINWSDPLTWKHAQAGFRDKHQGTKATLSDGTKVSISNQAKKIFQSHRKDGRRELVANQIHKVLESAILFSDDAHDAGNADVAFKYAASVLNIEGQLYPVLLSIKVGKAGENVMYHLDGFEMRGRPVGFDTRGDQQRNDAASVAPTLITGRSTDSDVTIAEVYDIFKEYAENRERPLFKRDGDDIRGSILIPAEGVGQGETIINLFEKANLSTFLHETGHYFLSVAEALANSPEATPEIQEMHNSIKSWWRDNAKGVAKDAGAGVSEQDVLDYLDRSEARDQSKDQSVVVGLQEQFARMAEVYFLEGKAPSQDLKGAFEKFRAWLLSIYQRVKSLKVKATPEIKSVMDRMLATDAEIRAAEEDLFGELVWESAEAAGLTEAEYRSLVKLHKQAQDEAHGKMLKEAMEPIKRERDEWFKKEKASVRQEIEQDMNRSPVYRALEWMGNKRWLDEKAPADLPAIKLSRSELVRRYGEGILKTLPRGKFVIHGKDGVDPDVAAAFFGFSSGDEMVRALEKAPKRKEAIDAETDKVMHERHGDVLRDGRAEEAALNAVHGDKRGQLMAAELNVLNELAGNDERSISAQQARAMARGALSKMKVRDAMASHRFIAAERKAANELIKLSRQQERERMRTHDARRKVGKEARKSIADQDRKGLSKVNRSVDAANAITDKANDVADKMADLARQRLINHMLYSESLKVVSEVESAERLAKKMSVSKGIRERLAKTGHIDAVDEILQRYDFRKISASAEDRRGALAEYVTRMVEAGREAELSIPDEVLESASKKPYKALPVDLLRGIVDSLKNLDHVSRRWNSLIVAGKKRELQETVEGIAGAIEANIPTKPAGWTDQPSFMDNVKTFLAPAQTAATVLRIMDGGDVGVASEALKWDIDEAATKERDLRSRAANDLREINSVYSDHEQIMMSQKEHHQELDGSYSKWELIVMALNMGAEENLARLTNQHARMSLKPAQVEYVKTQLTQKDWDYVSSVWQYLESWWPDIAAHERDLTGIEPKRVEPVSVETPFGAISGGYFPIKYQAEHGGGDVQTEEGTADLLKSFGTGRSSKAQTKNGHKKARGQNGRRSLKLDIGIVSQHMNEVIHDISFAGPVTQAWVVLNHPRVEGSMVEAGMREQWSQLQLWLKDVATGPVGSGGRLEQAAKTLRSNFAFSKIAFNFWTMMLQPLGVSHSAVVAGKRQMAKAMMDYARSPETIAKMAFAKSRILSDRRDTFQKDLYDLNQALNNSPAVKSSKLGKGALAAKGYAKKAMRDWVVPAGAWGLANMQVMFVDVPTWVALYRKGIAKYDGDETKAIHFADSELIRAQAGGEFAHRSNFERGTLSETTRQNAWVQFMTTLYSYFGAKLNLAMAETASLRQNHSAADISNYAANMSLLFVFEALVISAGRHLLDGLDDDDQDDEPLGFYKDLATGTLDSAAGSIPILRDAWGAAKGFDAGTYGSILSTLSGPAKQVAQGEVDRAAIKSVINALGVMTGAPSTAPNRLVDAAFDAAEGDSSVAEVTMRGLIGKRPDK